MKHYLLIIALLLSAIEMAATPHTYLYTFNQSTFTGTISQKDSLLLNNKYIYISATNSPTCTFSNGLKITSSTNDATINLYHKYSTPTTTGDFNITLESTGSNNLYGFTTPGNIVSPSNCLPTYSTTITYDYNASITGPKIVIHLAANSSVTIHSISFTYTDNSNSKDYNIYNGNTLIGSFNVPLNESYDIPSQPIATNSNQFEFAGYSYSSTPLYNSSDNSTIINQIPVNGISNTDLYSCYSHPRPNETIQTLTLTPSSTGSTQASFTFTPTSAIHLVSAYFHAKNESGNTDNLFLSASSDTKTLRDTVAYSTSLLKYSYHSLLTDGMVSFPANDAIIFRASSMRSISCDTLILTYYDDTSLSPRYYSTPQTNDVLHIHLTDTTPLTSAQTAIDDISYTMTIDDSRYYFFSLPFAVPFSNITFSPISGPLPTTYYYGYNNGYLGDWVISRYDEPTNQWIDMTASDLSAGLQPFVGYTIGLSQPCTTAVTFRSTYAPDNTPHSISPDQPSQTLTLSYTSTNQPKDRGWNLIGNPYYTPLSTLNIPANYILIPQSNSTTYDIIHPYSETTTATTLAPFSSFFIQSTATSLTINPQPSTINPQSATAPYHFNILCTTPDNYTSCLTILISDSYSEKYEIGLDLKSLSPYDDITHDGLAIYAAPLGVGDTITFTLPAGCSANNLSIGQNIYIPDNWDLDILDDSHLVIEDNTPTGIEDVNDIEDVPGIGDTAPSAIYTIDGRLLPTTDFSTLPSGIYILIINNKPLKILKQ